MASTPSTAHLNLSECAFLFFIWIVSNLVVRFLINICINSRAKTRNPPSPRALPIIGHLHLLRFKLPESFQNLARRYGPLMQIRIGTSTTFVIASSATVAKEILKTHDIDFASRFEFGPTEYNIYSGDGFVTCPNNTYWLFMKKLCMTKLLAGPQLDRFNHIREQEIQNLLKSLFKSSREGEACDLAMELTTLTNNLLCRMALSKRCSENAEGAKEVRKLIVEIMQLGAKLGVNEALGPLKKFDLFGNGKKLVEAMWRYDQLCEQIIKEYEDEIVDGQGKEDADLMSIVLEIYKDTNAEVKLTRNQIKFFFMEIFMASIDTLTAAIQWAMAELINHPQPFKRLREEINTVVGANRLVKESDVPNLPYLQAVVKETLRLHSPVPLIHRECTKDCTINGFHVKAKSKVLINVYAIMRDPEQWKDPDEFLPERFSMNSNDKLGQHQMEIKGQDFHYLPFGGGRRGCIGGTHALLVTHVTLGALTQCFDWKVKGGEKIDINVGSGFSGAMPLPLICYPIARFDPF